jgi:hypothetical protein
VLGVSAKEKVTRADYEKIFIPALEKKLKANKKNQYVISSWK